MKRATRIIIDKLTNSIEKRTTGRSFETNVVLVNSEEIKTILKKNGWLFNWRKEYMQPGRHIFKLVLDGDNQIQGLICLEPMDNFIEMPLIETAPHNFGKTKEYVGVPGNLVAFACKMSFEMGMNGVVSFNAKTMLVQHYIDSLGATILIRNRMAIFEESAKKLVNLYFKNYLNENG